MISALMELLGNFYQSGNFSQVEVIAHTIRAAIPNDMISLQVLGLAYLKTGRTADAIKLFRKTDEEDCQAQLQLSTDDATGQSHCESASLVCYREATAQSPGLAKLWYDLGKALIDLRQPKRSAWAFRAATIAAGSDLKTATSPVSLNPVVMEEGNASVINCQAIKLLDDRNRDMERDASCSPGGRGEEARG